MADASEVVRMVQEIQKKGAAMNHFITTLISFGQILLVFQILRHVCGSAFTLEKVDQQDCRADD